MQNSHLPPAFRRAVTYGAGALAAVLTGAALYALPQPVGAPRTARVADTAASSVPSADSPTPSTGQASPSTGQASPSAGSAAGSGSGPASAACGASSAPTPGTPSASPLTSPDIEPATPSDGASTTPSAPAPAAASLSDPASSTPSASAAPSFHGIYAFSGGNTSDLASDPDVAGRSLVYYWAQLEPQQGQYCWNLIDQDMKPWVAAGKKVVLRVSAAGWAKWDTAADSAHGTPAWVYAQGVKSVTEQDGAVMPEYWNQTFESDLDTFLAAFAARYDGNAAVSAVDISIGVGGESKADSEKNPDLLSLWQSIGYTDELWWGYAQHTITTYTSVFHRTPLALMPDKTFIGSTAGYDESRIVDYAVAKGIWLQDNGVVPGRTLSAPWGRTPVIAEMRGATGDTGDNLADDLQAAAAEHPVFILVFTSDITDANRAVLHQVAATAGTGG
ncbi:MAG: beta-galactosidase [Streptomyces sp.]|uniref:beta-galactosidase n=1 Tax=Streptomyces sp. TaxID=1931 RepID=UPI0025D1B73E|nr:beta-galactosidase [Streptomyces sp.]MBW8792558.1 beta-galactosidase [Streptomyces sp.]